MTQHLLPRKDDPIEGGRRIGDERASGGAMAAHDGYPCRVNGASCDARWVRDTADLLRPAGPALTGARWHGDAYAPRRASSVTRALRTARLRPMSCAGLTGSLPWEPPFETDDTGAVLGALVRLRTTFRSVSTRSWNRGPNRPQWGYVIDERASTAPSIEPRHRHVRARDRVQRA